MDYEKILNSPHKELIDAAIDQGYAPSIIREALVREGVDEFSISDINSYIEYYYQVVLNQSIREQETIYTTLNSSVPVLMASNIADSEKKVTYQTLLELDVLRAEKFIQDLSAGRDVPIRLQDFEKLTRIKQSVINSLTTFIEYKRAIQEAQAAQFNSTRVDIQKLGPYLDKLSDKERSVVLDVLNLLMESKTEEVTRFLPKNR